MCGDVCCVVYLPLNILGVPSFHLQPDGIAALLFLDVCTVTYEYTVVLVLCDEQGIRAVFNDRHILYALAAGEEGKCKQDNQGYYKDADAAHLGVVLTVIRPNQLEAVVIVAEVLIHCLSRFRAKIAASSHKVKGEVSNCYI